MSLKVLLSFSSIEILPLAENVAPGFSGCLCPTSFLAVLGRFLIDKETGPLAERVLQRHVPYGHECSDDCEPNITLPVDILLRYQECFLSSQSELPHFFLGVSRGCRQHLLHDCLLKPVAETLRKGNLDGVLDQEDIFNAFELFTEFLYDDLANDFVR